jgi:hypothetical protein
MRTRAAEQDLEHANLLTRLKLLLKAGGTNMPYTESYKYLLLAAVLVVGANAQVGHSKFPASQQLQPALASQLRGLTAEAIRWQD